MKNSPKSFSVVDPSPGRKGPRVLVGREIYLNALSRWSVLRRAKGEEPSVRGSESDSGLWQHWKAPPFPECFAGATVGLWELDLALQRGSCV